MGMVYTTAPNRWVGVMDTLNMVSDRFRLVLRESGTKSLWSAYQWSRERRGG